MSAGRYLLGEASEAVPADSFESVYEAHYAKLVGALRLGGASRADAEDIAQEAFARALARWPALRRGFSAGYLYRTGFRLQRRHRAASGGLVAVENPAPDSVAEQAVDREVLAMTLRALPARQRQCVLLRYYVGFSTAEVAKVLGIRAGTVRVHVHAARQRLGQLDQISG